MARVLTRLAGFFPASLFLVSLLPAILFAEEYSIIEQGTVMGRSYGVPSEGALGELTLISEAAFYFKTLELFNLDVVTGETYTGYRLPLSLRYRPRPDLALELGAVLGHEFGDADRLNSTAPLVRLVYEPTAGLYVIGGTLLSNHWMHDALLDDVQKFRVDVEQGFQLRADQSWLKSDTWIHWRLREGTESAEEFEIGSAQQLRPLGDTLHLDIQFLWTHAGGQLSTSGRVEQNLIYLAGVSAGTSQPLGMELLEEIRVGFSGLYSREETDHSGLENGYGRVYAVRTDWRLQRHFLFRLFAEIHDGDGFQATLGDPLYQLDDYKQLGANVLFNVADGHLAIEGGFVKQWTGEHRNLTYQLAMVWDDAFSLLKLRP